MAPDETARDEAAARNAIAAPTTVASGAPGRPGDGSEPSADGHSNDTIERTQLASAPGIGAVQPSPTAPGPISGSPQPTPVERQGGCTTAQLRRFIKSRAYVPMHEIRRRFLIATEDDDVAGIDLESGRVFVGLPPREGQMLGELLRGGEVGYELQLDPVAPVVVGVYPMRPVSRS